jgi:hypothetical protein
MSKYDDEINKILFEVNFMGGLNTFGQGVAGIAQNLKPVANLAGKALSTATNAAVGALGANLTVNPGVAAFAGKVSSMFSTFINKMQGVDDSIKIDDELIKTLNGVYGAVQDTTRYSSRANLGNSTSIVVAMVNDYTGYNLKRFGNEIWNTIKLHVFTKPVSSGVDPIPLSGDELISTAKQTIDALGKGDKSAIARYNAEIKLYDREWQRWFKTPPSSRGLEPQPPVDPTDNSKSSGYNNIGLYLRLHDGKNTYNEAIEHLLQFLSTIHKNSVQRAAATARDLTGTLNTGTKT